MNLSNHRKQWLTLTSLTLGAVLAANMSPPWPQLGIMVLIAYYGGAVLDRLSTTPKSAYHFQGADTYLKVRIDNLIEDDFEVAYVDEWQAGRSFTMYGRVVESDDIEKYFEPALRIGISIYPSAEWFQSAVIGHARGSITVQMPYQLANHLLTEIRRDLDQVVSIGLLAREDGKAIPSQQVCSFSMTAWNN